MVFKNKSASHVGVIISFVVFITFIVFIFFIIQPPLTINKEKEASLDYVAPLLAEYFSDDLIVASFYVKNSVGSFSSNCLVFKNFSLVSDNGLNENNIVIKNSTSNLQYDWQPSTKDLLVKNTGQNRFFKAYLSKSINSVENSLQNCQDITQENYYFGIVKKEKKVFEKKIIDGFESYKTNYEAMKKEIGIGPREDFGFDFIYENGTVLSTGQNNFAVATKEILVNYLSKDLSNDYGRIIIRMW